MICYFGHHRSGSSYIRSVLESVAVASGRTTSTIHNIEDYKSDTPLSLLIATNSSKKYLEIIPFEKAFHVIRDPRDVIVSSYFSHLFSHKTDVWKDLATHREQLKRLSKEEGLMYEIESCRKQQFIDLKDWEYQHDHILEIKFEDFVQDLHASWRQFFKFLDWSFSDRDHSLGSLLIDSHNRLVRKFDRKAPNLNFSRLYAKQNPSYKKLDQIIEQNDFNTRTGGRIPGSEDIKHHYRKGISGDWKNHFSPEIKNCFKQNWGDLLIKLGYEKNLNW